MSDKETYNFLSRLLKSFLAEYIEEELATLRKEIQESHVRKLDLLEENCILRTENDKLKNDKNILLDEIAQNQKRIDSILRQLKEKKG